jgi:hypothetical protein
MTTTTRQTKAGTITRSIEVSDNHQGLSIAHVLEKQGQALACDGYYLRRQPLDFGVAFQVEVFQGRGGTMAPWPRLWRRYTFVTLDP